MLIDTMENIWFRQHSHVCDVARLEHEDNFTGYMHDEKMHIWRIVCGAKHLKVLVNHVEEHKDY